MLVLSRKIDETIVIGDSVRITIIGVRGDKVRIGIEAPEDVTVHRQEIYDAIRGQAADAQSNQEDSSAERMGGGVGQPSAGGSETGVGLHERGEKPERKHFGGKGSRGGPPIQVFKRPAVT